MIVMTAIVVIDMFHCHGQVDGGGSGVGVSMFLCDHYYVWVCCCRCCVGKLSCVFMLLLLCVLC